MKVLEWDTEEIKQVVIDQAEENAQELKLLRNNLNELDGTVKKLRTDVDYFNKCRKDAEIENQ